MAFAEVGRAKKVVGVSKKLGVLLQIVAVPIPACVKSS